MTKRTSLWQMIMQHRLFWPVIGLALLLLFNLVFSKTFFTLEVRDGHLYGTLVDILNRGAKVMLLAIGMTIVIGTSGIDLSVGSMMAMSGAMAALIITETHMPLGAAIVIALATTVVAGAWNGVLVAYVGMQPFVATLIMMVAGRGIAQLISGGQIPTLVDYPKFLYLGNGHLFGLPFPVTVVVIAFVLVALATRRTALGLFIEAVGDNETASRFAGVHVRMVKVMAYTFSGLCAGIAGLIEASNIKAADSNRVGEMMELDAIFAVVVGGTALTGGRFTLVGSIIGAILLQSLTMTLYDRGVSPYIASLPKALVILGVCLLQSASFRAALRKLIPARRPA